MNETLDLEDDFFPTEDASVEELLTDTALTANAIVQLLIEKKIITVEEFDNKIDQLLGELEGYEDDVEEGEFQVLDVTYDDEETKPPTTTNH